MVRHLMAKSAGVATVIQFSFPCRPAERDPDGRR
jgi:hypothetical protein